MEQSGKQDQVTVIIPAYNSAWCIGNTIDSVLRQTYRQMEIIVVDDGSTDDTPGILKSFGENIKIVTTVNQGPSHARNQGIARARGRFVAFLDADDLWLPKKIEKQVSLLKRESRVGFCSTRSKVQTPDGKQIGEWNYPDRFDHPLANIYSKTPAIAGGASGVMVKKEILDKTCGFDESITCNEDVDLWMRLSALTEYAFIPETLTVIVRSPNSNSSRIDAMGSSMQYIMKKNRHLLPSNLKGRFYQSAYAGMLSDLAKWEYRSGKTPKAMFHLLEGALRSPERQGKLMVSLFLAMIRGNL